MRAVVLATLVAALAVLAFAGTGRAGSSCNGFPVTLEGDAGDDTLIGTAGPDVIAGLGGDDTIEARGGDDIVCGGAGDDDLAGEGGNDEINGGTGFDAADFGSTNGVTVSLVGGTEDRRAEFAPFYAAINNIFDTHRHGWSHASLEGRLSSSSSRVLRSLTSR